jgi:hypothetical protein
MTVQEEEGNEAKQNIFAKHKSRRKWNIII